MNHGRDASNYELIDWMNELSKLEIGEIIINSIDNDGTNMGYDDDLIKSINSKINIPLIYGGGLCNQNNILRLLEKKIFSGISIGNSLHFDDINILNLKKFLKLKKKNINLFNE